MCEHRFCYIDGLQTCILCGICSDDGIELIKSFSSNPDIRINVYCRLVRFKKLARAHGLGDSRTGQLVLMFTRLEFMWESNKRKITERIYFLNLRIVLQYLCRLANIKIGSQYGSPLKDKARVVYQVGLIDKLLYTYDSSPQRCRLAKLDRLGSVS